MTIDGFTLIAAERFLDSVAILPCPAALTLKEKEDPAKVLKYEAAYTAYTAKLNQHQLAVLTLRQLIADARDALRR